MAVLMALISASLAGSGLLASDRADAENDADSAAVRTLGLRRELFVDDFLLDAVQDAQLRLHHPVPREVAIEHGEPWEGNTCAYHTVFQDQDRYRMYYRGAHFDEHAKRSAHEEWYCYAESSDGIHWVKPHLGLFEFNGSKANNIVWAGIGAHNLAPFKDQNPDCPSASRYKAVGGNREGLHAFHSEDGIHWSLMSDGPVITQGAFDSLNLAFWDTIRQRYVAFFRDFRNGVRDIKTCTSEDFLHWTEPQWLEYPDAPAEHLYTNAITAYFRAPHIFVGFPKRFVPDRNPQQHVHGGVSDGLFMTSRDGKVFHRWHEAWVRPGLQPERWVNRNNLAAWGVVRTAGTLPHTPDELSIYSTENYYRGTAVRLRRFTLRMDGFVSLHASAAGGEAVSPLLVFGPQPDGYDLELVLNMSTSAAGSVRCEFQNAEGQPLPGFALDDCDVVYGDRIEHVVTWHGNPSVGKLAGRPVRIRWVLHDADVYSLQFRPGRTD